MVNEIVIIGSSSDLAQECINLFNQKSYKILTISSNKKFTPDLHVNSYLSSQEKIIALINKCNSPTVIFFNGYLKENRPIESPTIDEIFKTFFVNFKVPYLLTKNILLKNQKTKFIYISSIASLKFREKNFIYGYSKYLLENNVQKLTDNYLILKFGLINTKMSQNHSKPPFSLEKEDAAKIISNNLNNTGLLYPTKGLIFIKNIFRFIPIKIIDLIEKFLN